MTIFRVTYHLLRSIRRTECDSCIQNFVKRIDHRAVARSQSAMHYATLMFPHESTSTKRWSRKTSFILNKRDMNLTNYDETQKGVNILSICLNIIIDKMLLR